MFKHPIAALDSIDVGVVPWNGWVENYHITVLPADRDPVAVLNDWTFFTVRILPEKSGMKRFRGDQRSFPYAGAITN